LYLSDRDIEGDAQRLIATDVKSRLGEPTAIVTMKRIESSFGPLAFGSSQSALAGINVDALDHAGQLL